MIWWNGEPLPVPAAPIQYTYRNIEGTNSGQTLGGLYSKKIIARKEDVLISWQSLSSDEAATVASISQSTYGRLTYYSPLAGGYVTKTMHIETHTHELNDAVLKTGSLVGDFSAAIQFKQR